MLIRSIATISLFAAMTLSACSGEKTVSKRTAPEQSFGGLTTVVIEDSGLQLSSSEYSGSGKFVFEKPLHAIKAKQTFTFSAKVSEAGWIDFRSFGYGNLVQSLSLKIARSADGNTAAFGSETERTEPETLDLDLTNDVYFQIQVDNNASPASVQLSASPTGIDGSYTEIFTSEGNETLKPQGYGSYFGFELNQSTLKTFKAE